MTAEQILEEAKKELARVEAEATRLRAIVAAAEGKATAPVLPPPNFVPVPYTIPAPSVFSRPLSPDYVHEPVRWWGTGEVTCGSGSVMARDGSLVFGPGPTIDNSIRYGSH